ncbi:CG1231 [Drosophila busckii]|uniref:CG1231 n=1 Tax=Drosophila busckii TaxID=30019 RepID=A0A0M4EP58_DROBS|nr:CG1231 [Drosophila busckii]
MVASVAPQPVIATPTSEASINNVNRFLSPGKPIETIDATVIAAVTQRPQKRKLSQEPCTEGSKLIFFSGRDESYPAELNKLIEPLSCQLCKTQMTSMKCAKDHYGSKAHDRHMNAWLAKNYTEMGLETPPIKRLLKEGPIGPNAFHCELCDLPLTSATHARQHYAGRRHQLVQQKRSKPSGAEPKVTDDGRFGIGELFIQASKEHQLINTKETNNGQPLDEGLHCKICKIRVSSKSQIQMHLDGAKHQKNLRKQLIDPDATTTKNNQAATIPAGDLIASKAQPEADKKIDDLPMYRTPSGSYYCKLCNMAMNHITILQQHLQGKKHLKNMRQQHEKTTN